MILIGVLILFAFLFGGGRLLGCAWHIFLIGAVLILVLAVVIVFVAGRSAMTFGLPLR